MWQFTREFIINDNEGKLNGNRFIADGEILKVDHMINVKAKDVCSAYKAEGEAEANEVINIAAPELSDVLAVGDVVRLKLVLGQEGRVISTFNDQYPEHSRTFLYEAKVEVADEIPFAALAEAIKKETAMFESPFFAVVEDAESAGSSAGDDLTLAALDCYTRFDEVQVVKVPLDADRAAGAVLTGYQDYVVLVEADRKALLSDESGESDVTLVTEGNTGKNTTNYIIHNLRLQTAANINPYGTNMDERPLPKSLYDQYTLELVTERRQIGHQVMGAIDQSLVTVIFFVHSSVSAEFASALEAAGITVEEPAATAPIKRIVALAKDVQAEEGSESV